MKFPHLQAFTQLVAAQIGYYGLLHPSDLVSGLEVAISIVVMGAATYAWNCLWIFLQEGKKDHDAP